MRPSSSPSEGEERRARGRTSCSRSSAASRSSARSSEHNPELTLSDVARATGLTRAAARRFLLTLAELGYVRTDGRWFALSPRILELGYAYLSSLSLPEVAEPHLERLVAEVHESSSVSVLDGEDIVYVARVPTSRIMTVSINVGTRFPAYATSMGRVLLAGLPDERARRLPRRAVELAPLSPRTLTSHDALRAELAQVRVAGLGARRPGARGGAALDRRADPRPQRPHRRRGQPVRAREPDVDRARAARARPAAAGDRGADRGGPARRPGRPPATVCGARPGPPPPSPADHARRVRGRRAGAAPPAR